MNGYLNIVLHAHLPFVRHPEFEDFLEEDWFYEACLETYMPLLSMFERLHNDKVPFKLTMSITPTLASMMKDSYLMGKLERRIYKLMELIDKEKKRKKDTPFYESILMYEKWIKSNLNVLKQYDFDLTEGFKRFYKSGNIELITCNATHAFLPFMQVLPKLVEAQVKVGVDSFKQTFGFAPRGIWLAECGYYRGVEEILAKNNIDYFFGETHCIMYADEAPKYGVYAPMYTPNLVACFARDPGSSKQVWSAKEGYPGDFDYREFYRDIGFDEDYEYIKPYLHLDGQRRFVGLKYYRITSDSQDLGNKAPYNPSNAQNKVKIHAANFLFNRQKQLEYLNTIMDRKPIINAMFDCELFGHWWWEGINFLEEIFRQAHNVKEFGIEFTNANEYLSNYPTNQMSNLCESSWGYKGYGDVWCEGSNEWIYRLLFEAGIKMVEKATLYKNTKDKKIKRLLNQMARELLLAQASDWAFIMKTGTMVDYAVKRTKLHFKRFDTLLNFLEKKAVDKTFLETIEYRDNIFPKISFRVFSL